MIGRNKPTISIENPEPIRIAIRRQARQRLLFNHFFLQRSKMVFRWIGPAPVKQHVARFPNRRKLHTMASEYSVEPPRTASMQRIANKAAFRFLDHLETNQLLELRKIRLARIDPREVILNFQHRPGLLAKSRRALLDIFRDLGQRRTAIRPRKFQSVVLGRIVARSDVHAAFEFSVKDRVCNRRVSA